MTLRALELGAVDFVAKPKIGVADGLSQLADDITDKIRVAAQAQVRRSATAPPRQPITPRSPAAPAPLLGRLSTEKLIFIGASTGGTEATKDVLIGPAGRLPGDPDHAAHAARLHDQLRQAARRRCAASASKEAVDGERVLPGHAYLAPGGLHLSGRALGRELHRARPRRRAGEPPPSRRSRCCSSRPRAWSGPNALGVMLTGMGADGAQAMREMRDAGSYNICQDEASCVVFGMPREAIAAARRTRCCRCRASPRRWSRACRARRAPRSTASDR